MKITINGVEYSTSRSQGVTKILWDSGKYVSPLVEIDALKEVILTSIREQRDEALRESDWRLGKDYPYDDQDEWLDYRQDLRGLPSTYIHGNDIVLPTKPGE